MRSITIKSVLSAVLGVAIVILFAACSVGINDFLEDPAIKEIVENNRVKLVDKSGDNLRVGNQRITGLKPNSYYLVQEWDKYIEPANISPATEEEEEEENDPELLSTNFVGTDGALVPLFKDIGKIPADGGLITNLSNSNTYVVYSASPILFNFVYHTNINLPVPEISNSSGLSLPQGAVLLEVAHQLKPSTEIIGIPINYEGNTRLVTLDTLNRIILEGNGTTTDYLFIEYDNNGEIIIDSFRVLRVIIGGTQPANSFRIHVSFNFTDETPVLITEPANQFPIIISQDKLITKTANIPSINIVNSDDFESIKWLSNNEEISTGATLDLKDIMFNDDEYWMVGTHIFTVEAKKKDSGSLYSAKFMVAVT